MHWRRYLTWLAVRLVIAIPLALILWAVLNQLFGPGNPAMRDTVPFLMFLTAFTTAGLLVPYSRLKR